MWSERRKSSFCMVSNIASMGMTKGVIFGFFSERCTVLRIFASRRRNWHQPTSKATDWPLQVASAVSQPLIGPGSCSVKRWKRTLFCLLFWRSLFSWPPKLKKFAQYPSHRIFRHMHGVLNVGNKITNCTVCL
jgi:hypothetical protein